MAYIGTADTAGGFSPVTARQEGTPRRHRAPRDVWRRAFARLLVARRHAAEREVAEFARLSGLDLPASARRLRRIVQASAR